MLEKANSTNPVGVDLQGGTLRTAFLTLKKGKPALEKLSAGSGGDLGKHLIVTALPTDACLVRSLQFKLDKDKDIEAVLAFQAEPLLPYPVDEGILDWIKLSQGRDGTEATIIAAKKEHLRSHLEACKSLGFEPEVVSAVPVALAVFSGFFLSNSALHFLLDVGETKSSCLLVRKGKLIAAQECSFGLSSLEASYPLTEESLAGASHAFEKLCRELMKVLFSLSKQAKGEETPEILVTGIGGAQPLFVEKLCEKLEKEPIAIASKPHFNCPHEELVPYATAIGLALTALPGSPEQINFRRQEFAYPNPWKRLKKPVAAYFAASLALAWALHLFGQAYLGYQEDKIKEHYGDLLALLHKPYLQFESEYERKHPGGRSGKGEFLALEELSNDELYARLEQLHKEVSEAPDPVALYPNVPRVSDILAWLSTHPKVTLAGEAVSGIEAPIQIENFSYTMVQRPEEKKKSDRYQVKVEIEFSSPTPKLAREFHDSLIAPNPIVDPKGEVKWSSSRGKYRTSFILKDKTSYPAQLQGGG